jgi:hypothetical protein
MLVVALAGGRLSAKPPAETVHLEVNGGIWTGTYNAVSTAGGCTAGAHGPDSWSNELFVSGANDPKALVNLPMEIPNAKSAETNSADFYLAIGFGPLNRRMAATYQLEIETRTNQKRPPSGTGTVTVTDKGDTATIAFSAKVVTGESVTGTVTCNTVTRKK